MACLYRTSGRFFHATLATLQNYGTTPIEAQCGTACLTMGDCHTYGSIKQGYWYTLAPLFIQKDHGQLLIKSALHSLCQPNVCEGHFTNYVVLQLVWQKCP